MLQVTTFAHDDFHYICQLVNEGISNSCSHYSFLTQDDKDNNNTLITYEDQDFQRAKINSSIAGLRGLGHGTKVDFKLRNQ